MAGFIPRNVWLETHKGNLKEENQTSTSIKHKHGEEEHKQLFSIPGLFPFRNLAIAFMLIEPSLLEVGLKTGLPKLSYLKGEIIESLPRFSLFSKVLALNLYRQTIQKFVENNLNNEFGLAYESLKFSHNGTMSEMNPLGILLAEMKDDTNFPNYFNQIPELTVGGDEKAYIEQVKQIKDLKLLQLNRNIAFTLATLDKSGFAENLLTSIIVLAIGKCLEQKNMKDKDLATLNSENLSIESLVNLVGVYGLSIDDYEFIESFVAYEGVFLIPQKDGSQQLVVPILSANQVTELVFDDENDANPTGVYIRRNSISDPSLLIIHDPHHSAYGEGTVDVNIGEHKNPTLNSPIDAPTFKSVIKGDESLLPNAKISQDDPKVGKTADPANDRDSTTSERRAREDREKLETRVILTSEQLLIYLYGTEEEKRNLIQELSGIKPPKALKSRKYEKPPEVETLPIEEDVVKLMEDVVTDESSELETSDTSEESNFLAAEKPEQGRIEHQFLPNVDPYYQEILLNAGLSPQEIAELDTLDVKEIGDIADIADRLGNLYKNL